MAFTNLANWAPSLRKHWNEDDGVKSFFFSNFDQSFWKKWLRISVQLWSIEDIPLGGQENFLGFIIKDILGTCGPEWQRQVAIFSPLHSIEAPSRSAGKPRNCLADKKSDLNIYFLAWCLQTNSFQVLLPSNELTALCSICRFEIKIFHGNCSLVVAICSN